MRHGAGAASALLMLRVTSAFWASPLPLPGCGAGVAARCPAMAAGGRGGRPQPRRGSGGRRSDERNSGLPDAGRMYEYVRGGFAEKEMPSGMGDKDGMYEEFDSALRAASYNMFCSPLKPVNAPSAAKAGQAQSAGAKRGGEDGRVGASGAIKFSGDKVQEEDPEEVSRRTQEQYAELDRLIQGDTRATSGNAKLNKMQRKSSKLSPVGKKVKGKGIGLLSALNETSSDAQAADSASFSPASPPAAATANSSARSDKMTQRMRKAKGNGMGPRRHPDLATSLKGLAVDEFSSLDGTSSSEEEVLVEEGYEVLQSLLGHKPMGGSKRKLNSARFTGNLTKYREAGMFKRVTLKDPLSRVYAQRLLREPPPVSSSAITRPPKPGADASPTPLDGASIAAGMMSSKAEAQAPAKAAETFVDDILAGAQKSARQARSPAQPPKKVAARRKASKEWTAEQYEQFDNLLNGADVDAAGQAGKGAFMSGSQDASAPRQTAAPSIKESGKRGAKADGKAQNKAELKGRVVMNHSTHIPGLINVLNRLVETDGVFTVVPGQLSKGKANAAGLVLRVQAPTDQGFRLVARKGTQIQEVFVVSDLEKETLEAAIAWSL